MLHVAVEGAVNEETGFVKDYAEISEVVKPLIDKLDHHHLGAWNIPWTGLDLSPNTHLEYVEQWAVPGLPRDFYPSSENLLVWIGKQLKEAGLDWSKVALEETCTSYCELTRVEYEGNLAMRDPHNWR